MQIIILRSEKEAAARVADLVAEQVKKKKTSVLGLATGKTMIPIYREIARRKINFSRVKTFNLDEYAGGDSLRKFMERNFFGKVNLKEKNIFFLDGKARDWKSECSLFEGEIRRAGGIDLQILGVGRNGHIGFNEPGSSLKSRTRRVRLSLSTRHDNGTRFGYALTMGVGTIMSARRIVLAALGGRKAEIVGKVIDGRTGSGVPASFLRRHRRFLLVLDGAAAGE